MSRIKQSVIKQQAIKLGYIPEIKIKKVNGKRIADFKSAGVVRKTIYLPKELWNKSDNLQFKWLNDQIGGKIKETT